MSMQGKIEAAGCAARAVQLKHCSVAWAGDVVVVTFEDGSVCTATPHQTPHYYVIAHRCGYGDDVAAYAFEHEVIHALCAEWFHDEPSRVLWNVAQGSMLSGKAAAPEEILVQTAQRWIRANERPIVGGVDWDAFKAAALTLLDHREEAGE